MQDLAVPWSVVFEAEAGVSGTALAEISDPELSFYRAGFQIGAAVASAGAEAVFERLRAAATRERRARAEDMLRRVRGDFGVLHHSTDSEDSDEGRTSTVREES